MPAAYQIAGLTGSTDYRADLRAILKPFLLANGWTAYAEDVGGYSALPNQNGDVFHHAGMGLYLTYNMASAVATQIYFTVSEDAPRVEEDYAPTAKAARAYSNSRGLDAQGYHTPDGNANVAHTDGTSGYLDVSANSNVLVYASDGMFACWIDSKCFMFDTYQPFSVLGETSKNLLAMTTIVSGNGTPSVSMMQVPNISAAVAAGAVNTFSMASGTDMLAYFGAVTATDAMTGQEVVRPVPALIPIRTGTGGSSGSNKEQAIGFYTNLRALTYVNTVGMGDTVDVGDSSYLMLPASATQLHALLAPL